MVSTAEFEAARPQLTAVAFRLLGSIHDAEDAVQSTWIKASTANHGDLRNPAAWLTTVLTRVCLDHLRRRKSRREEPLFADVLAPELVAADEQFLDRENVSRALMVVLSQLTPAQRVAYVLHDLFDVPFREVAQTLATSPDNAKKHASRARRRIEQTAPAQTTNAIDDAVVEAFLSAAAGGRIDRMVTLMASDCTRVVEAALVPPSTPTLATGARTVATETKLFTERIRSSTPLLVNNRPARVIAPGGHPLAVIDITVRDQRVVQINISRASTHMVFAIPSTTSYPQQLDSVRHLTGYFPESRYSTRR